MRRQWFGVWVAIFLGIIFVVAGIGKVFAQSDNFAPFLLPEFLPSFLVHTISTIVPYIEIIIGALLIIGIAIKFATSLSAMMIMGFIISNILLISLGLASQPCGCFGGVIGGGLSVRTSLMLDGIMALMVLAIFLFHPDRFKSIKPWYLIVEQDIVSDIPALEKRRLS